MTLSQHIQDFEQLSERFRMTNRYLLLRHVDSRLLDLPTRELSRFVRAIADVGCPAETHGEVVDGVPCVHFSLRTWNQAREVRERLRDFQRRVSGWPGGGYGRLLSMDCAQSDSMDLRERTATVESVVRHLGSLTSLLSRMEVIFTGPRRASSTLWIGHVRSGRLHDDLRDRVTHSNFGRPLLRVFRHFGLIRRYRIMPEKNCSFIVYDRVDDAIAARNALFGAELDR